MNERTIVVVSRHWAEPQSELSFVSRSLAGAATRFGKVRVLTGAESDRPSADGAFDVSGIGLDGRHWPSDLPHDCIVLVDELSEDLATVLLQSSVRDVYYISAEFLPAAGNWHRLHFVAHSGPEVVNVHVPVNCLAEKHRHNGFGFTGYDLVLSGADTPAEDLPSSAAWLTAAFHDHDVIVVAGGTASAWRGRALRGQVAVETRMDLWRLMAHANICVDLSPGRYLARECIESMRFGTPIAVPSESGPAALHAHSGGGWTFRDPHELITCVSDLCSSSTRSAAGQRARQYADANHGSSDRLVTSLRIAVDPK